MKTIYVKNLDRGIGILKYLEIDDTHVYLLRIHPELTFFQNILLNIPLISIEERK